jgi:multidrug efflux pump subunit AcrA (membrane-fusion protein)
MKVHLVFKKTIFLSLLVLLGITLAAMASYRHFHSSTSPITSFSVQKGNIMECVYGVGTVTSDKTFQVKAGFPSKINAIFVKEGDVVSTGAKLIALETLFTAPFAGTVTSISGSVGETAFPSAILINLVDLTHKHILVTLDQSGALRVQKGQKVKLNFDGLRSQNIVGYVAAIYPKDNHFLVRIDVENFPNLILPGMTADVAIEISAHKDALLVPLAALSNKTVLVQRKEQKNILLKLSLGLVDGSMVEVISGNLQEGDLIVVGDKVNK